MRVWIEEGRPGDKAAISKDSQAGESAATILAEIPRCRVCRHPLATPESIAAGVGEKCARRERGGVR